MTLPFYCTDQFSGQSYQIIHLCHHFYHPAMQKRRNLTHKTGVGRTLQTHVKYLRD